MVSILLLDIEKGVSRRTLSERFGHCSLIEFFGGYTLMIIIKFQK